MYLVGLIVKLGGIRHRLVYRELHQKLGSREIASANLDDLLTLQYAETWVHQLRNETKSQ